MRITKLTLNMILQFTLIVYAHGQESPYDSPPMPAGGYAAIQEALQYPKDAITKGVEGTVIVLCDIDTLGKVVDTQVLKGNPVFHVAARDAVTQIQWIPAMKEGKPAQVRISVPVVFRVPAYQMWSEDWEGENIDKPEKEPRKFGPYEKYKLIGTVVLLGVAFYLFR